MRLGDMQKGTDELARRLSALHTAAMSDALRKRGNIWTVMHSSMKPVWPGARVAKLLRS